MTPVRTPTTDEVEDSIITAIRDLLDQADEVEVTRESTFKELDVDSLDVVELRQFVRSRMGVELTVDDLTAMRSAGDVIDLVIARAG